MPTDSAKTLFMEAVELTDPAARRTFLDQACAEDPALRDRVDRLLEAQRRAEPLFAVTPLPETGTGAPAELQSRIGRYKLQQRLGEGGCGVVYLAEQEEPVRRPVALKIIRIGMDSESVIARFEQERQALALMDHPNIARVLDAGATESGLPYFVMAVVQGVKITDYCDQNNLDIPARLELFIHVCHAVQHAHQKGVIHRDIKPSNILITQHDDQPVPKLIDFGIAQATAAPSPDSAASTPLFIGTPDYMSPEQAGTDGADIDTRSDIYSLGVLLCELLTGRTPCETRTTAPDPEAVRLAILERTPSPPSHRLSSLSPQEQVKAAGHRRLRPSKLLTALQGDLDAIVMRALARDRRNRYDTVSALALDIRRHLDNEPVDAHPTGRLDLTRKWVRRHKAAFTAVSAVSVSLTLGLGTSTWLFFKERESRRQAEQGRINEIVLRQQAENHAKIGQALYFVEQQRFYEAEAVLAELPDLDAVLVGAAVFRPLGDEAARQGRWHDAANYFTVLVRVDQFEASEIATQDNIKCAVSLIMQGDPAAYERFCRNTIRRFGHTSELRVAERSLKSSLLRPPSSELLTALAPLANTLEQAPYNKSYPSWVAPWRCMTLALYEYRRGNFARAVHWGESALNTPPMPPHCIASSHAILALAYHQLGQNDDSLNSLTACRELLANKFKGDRMIDSSQNPYWHDWVLCWILEREAAPLIDDRPLG